MKRFNYANDDIYCRLNNHGVGDFLLSYISTFLFFIPVPHLAASFFSTGKTWKKKEIFHGRFPEGLRLKEMLSEINQPVTFCWWKLY